MPKKHTTSKAKTYQPRTDAPEQPKWAELLTQAVREPGIVSECYRRFWNYSLGNQLLAMTQLLDRKIQLGPINTYNGWQALGRQVQKGEKALVLCMPLSSKRDTGEQDENGQAIVKSSVRFTFKPRWFTLAQTDGDPYEAPAVPEWDANRAAAALGIQFIPFESLDGNSQGYSVDGKIAVSPIAVNPIKTTVHEMAHALLHTGARHEDTVVLPRSLMEVEAESTAMLVICTLGLPGVPEARGYIQGWLEIAEIPEDSARRIMATADRILKAGREHSTAGTVY